MDQFLQRRCCLIVPRWARRGAGDSLSGGLGHRVTEAGGAPAPPRCPPRGRAQRCHAWRHESARNPRVVDCRTSSRPRAARRLLLHSNSRWPSLPCAAQDLNEIELSASIFTGADARSSPHSHQFATAAGLPVDCAGVPHGGWHHPAQARRRDQQDDRQFAAAPRQHRQTRGRYLADPGPLQRPGPAHGRHLPRKPSSCRSTSLPSSTASSRRDGRDCPRLMPARASWKGDVRGFGSLGWQFPAGSSRAVLDGARVVRPAPVSANRDQAQSHPPSCRVRLPICCRALGRIEIDRQASGEQAVSMEDSTCLHSRLARPAQARGRTSAVRAGNRCRSGKGDVEAHARIDWNAWIAELFAGSAMPSSAPIPTSSRTSTRACSNPAVFHGRSGRASEVEDAERQSELHRSEKSAFAPPPETDGVYELMTLRADGQFNTTIYTEDDRFRGIEGSRYVVFMNPADMEVDGLKSGDTVTLVTGGGRWRRAQLE